MDHTDLQVRIGSLLFERVLKLEPLSSLVPLAANQHVDDHPSSSPGTLLPVIGPRRTPTALCLVLRTYVHSGPLKRAQTPRIAPILLGTFDLSRYYCSFTISPLRKRAVTLNMSIARTVRVIAWAWLRTEYSIESPLQQARLQYVAYSVGPGDSAGGLKRSTTSING
jgi:hypothetical protein